MSHFHELWDYRDPAASEARFRARLDEGDLDREQALSLRTQIARAQGLQRDFEGAHRTLDAIEVELEPAHALARARLLLERGRAVRSSGDSPGSVQWFCQALEVADGPDLEEFAVDAAHMLAIADTERALEWTHRAISMAEAATSPRARGWLGALYNNGGWAHFERGELDQALDLFQRGEQVHRPKGNTRGWRIALWTIGRTYRAQGRIEEALSHQRTVLAHWESVGEDAGYTHEELGECLLALGDPDGAQPHFAEAHRVLSADPWLPTDDPARIARMAQLGGIRD